MTDECTVIARIPERIRRLQRVEYTTEPGQIRDLMSLPDGPPSAMKFAFSRPLPEKLSAPVTLPFTELATLVLVDPEKREAFYEFEE